MASKTGINIRTEGNATFAALSKAAQSVVLQQIEFRAMYDTDKLNFDSITESARAQELFNMVFHPGTNFSKKLIAGKYVKKGDANYPLTRTKIRITNAHRELSQLSKSLKTSDLQKYIESVDAKQASVEAMSSTKEEDAGKPPPGKVRRMVEEIESKTSGNVQPEKEQEPAINEEKEQEPAINEEVQQPSSTQSTRRRIQEEAEGEEEKMQDDEGLGQAEDDFDLPGLEEGPRNVRIPQSLYASMLTDKYATNVDEVARSLPARLESNGLLLYDVNTPLPITQNRLLYVRGKYAARLYNMYDSRVNILGKKSFSTYMMGSEDEADVPQFTVEEDGRLTLQNPGSTKTRWQFYSEKEMKEFEEKGVKVSAWEKDYRVKDWERANGVITDKDRDLYDEWTKNILKRRIEEGKDVAGTSTEDYRFALADDDIQYVLEAAEVDSFMSLNDEALQEAQSRFGQELRERFKIREDAFTRRYTLRRLMQRYEELSEVMVGIDKREEQERNGGQPEAQPEAQPELERQNIPPVEVFPVDDEAVLLRNSVSQPSGSVEEDEARAQRSRDIRAMKQQDPEEYARERNQLEAQLRDAQDVLRYYCLSENQDKVFTELETIVKDKDLLNANAKSIQTAIDALNARTQNPTMKDLFENGLARDQSNLDINVEEDTNAYLRALDEAISRLEAYESVLQGDAQSIDLRLRDIQLQKLKNDKLRFLRKVREGRARLQQVKAAADKDTLSERKARIEVAKANRIALEKMSKEEILPRIVKDEAVPPEMQARYLRLALEVQQNFDDGLHVEADAANGGDWFTKFRTGMISGLVGSIGAHEIMQALDPQQTIPHVPRLAIEGGIAGIGATYVGAGLEGGTAQMAAVTGAELGPAAVGFATYYEVQDATDRPITDALLKAGASQDAAQAAGDIGSNAAAGAASALAAEGTAAGIAAATGAGAAEGAEAGSIFGPLGTLGGMAVGAAVGAIFGFASWLIGKAQRSGGDGTMYDPRSHPWGSYGYLPNYNMGSPETYANWLNSTFPEGVRDGKRLQDYDTEDNRKRYEAWVKGVYDKHQEDIKAAAQARALYSVPAYEGLDAPTRQEMLQKTGQGIAPGEAAGFDMAEQRELVRSSPIDRVRMSASKQPAMQRLFDRENMSYHGFVGWLKQNAGPWLKTHAPKILESTMIALDQHGYSQVNEAVTGTARIVQQYVKHGMKNLGAIRATAKYLGIPNQRVNELLQVAKGLRSGAHIVLKAGKAADKHVTQQNQYTPTKDEETIAGRLMSLITEEQIDTSQYRHAYNKLGTEKVPSTIQETASYLVKQFPNLLVKPSVITLNDVQDMVVTAAASFMAPLYKGSPAHTATTGKKRKRDDECMCRLLEQIVENQKKMIMMQQAKDNIQDPVDLRAIEEQLPIENDGMPPMKKRKIIPGREGGLPTSFLKANAGFRFSQAQIDASLTLHRQGMSFAGDLNLPGIRLRVER